MLEKISNLEGVTELSNEQKSNVIGGYSRLYCLYHSTRIKVFDVIVKERKYDYEECRKM